MGQTTTKGCFDCQVEADAYSRECKRCGIAYCRTHKKMFMNKLDSKSWSCKTCPHKTSFVVTFEGRIRVRDLPTKTSKEIGYLSFGDTVDTLTRRDDSAASSSSLLGWHKIIDAHPHPHSSSASSSSSSPPSVSSTSYQGKWFFAGEPKNASVRYVHDAGSKEAAAALKKIDAKLTEEARKRAQKERADRERLEFMQQTNALNIELGHSTPSGGRGGGATKESDDAQQRRRTYTTIKRIPTLVTTPRGDMARIGKELMNQMMRFSGPDHWTPMPKGQNDALVELNPHSPEYKDALRHFRKTLSYKMLKIERVQNRYLWQRYLSRKMTLLSKNGASGVNERVLFHGTRATAPSKIWDGLNACGFDPRLGSGFYGKGAYFATRAQYSANGYAHSMGGRKKQLFLASVLTGVEKDFGKTTMNSLKRAPQLPSGHPRHPGLYDSVMGGPHSGTIMYIVYGSDQAYPLYLYTYEQ